MHLRVLSLEPQRDAWEVGESGGIGRYDRPAACERGGGDQEIVRSPRAPGATGVRQQAGMCPGHFQVVWLDRERGEHGLDESGTALLRPAMRELHSDEKLGGGNRRDRDVVVIGDDRIEGGRRALGGDENRRVENQSFQRRSSVASVARRSRSSDAQRRSGGAERRISFTRFPFAARAGSIRATVRPRRTTRKLSPRRSTESSSSEKRLAASVALSVRTRSDYQI